MGVDRETNLEFNPNDKAGAQKERSPEQRCLCLELYHRSPSAESSIPCGPSLTWLILYNLLSPDP